eukprot:g1966.t1
MLILNAADLWQVYSMSDFAQEIKDRLSNVQIGQKVSMENLDEEERAVVHEVARAFGLHGTESEGSAGKRNVMVTRLDAISEAALEAAKASLEQQGLATLAGEAADGLSGLPPTLEGDQECATASRSGTDAMSFLQSAKDVFDHQGASATGDGTSSYTPAPSSSALISQAFDFYASGQHGSERTFLRFVDLKEFSGDLRDAMPKKRRLAFHEFQAILEMTDPSVFPSLHSEGNEPTWPADRVSVALALAQEECQNGGWVQLSEPGPLGQWVISGNSLRAKGNPGFVLCARRDFQGIHLWSFDGLPDQYGQWNLEDVPDARSRARTSSDFARPRALSSGHGLLRPVISELHSAVMFSDEEETPKVLDIRSEQHSLVLVLERLGWRVSSCLETDNEKLTRLYGKAGLLERCSTMPPMRVRNLSFFAELFFLLADGLETSDGVNLAYARSLQEHHSFLQRQAFLLVYSQLSARPELLKTLEGELPLGPDELLEMAELARSITDFCFKLDQEMSQKISAEQAQFEVDAAYGKARAGSFA